MIYSAEEWLTLDFKTGENQLVIGTPEQAIIRVGTKNIVEAPEKSFKTTFMLRLALGLSCGKAVYSPLPVPKKRKVLYLHGELSPLEIQERTRAASVGLTDSFSNLFEGRDISMHFKEVQGRKAIEEAIEKTAPEVVIFDPWQAYITGLDENGFHDISEALKFIDRLIDKYKITVFLVTHTGKDRKKGTRGHSSMAGWRDTLIKLERDKRSKTLKVTVEPRWAAPLDPFHLKFDRGTLWPTNHFIGRNEEIRNFLMEHDGKASKEEVKAALKFSSKDAGRKAIERAEKAGAIVVTGDLVSLPESGEQAGQPHRVGVCPSGSCLPDKAIVESPTRGEDVLSL